MESSAPGQAHPVPPQGELALVGAPEAHPVGADALASTDSCVHVSGSPLPPPACRAFTPLSRVARQSKIGNKCKCSGNCSVARHRRHGCCSTLILEGGQYCSACTCAICYRPQPRIICCFKHAKDWSEIGWCVEMARATSSNALLWLPTHLVTFMEMLPLYSDDFTSLVILACAMESSSARAYHHCVGPGKGSPATVIAFAQRLLTGHLRRRQKFTPVIERTDAAFARLLRQCVVSPGFTAGGILRLHDLELQATAWANLLGSVGLRTSKEIVDAVDDILDKVFPQCYPWMKLT